MSYPLDGTFSATAATNQLSSAGHGLVEDQRIKLLGKSILPSPLEQGRSYYVLGIVGDAFWGLPGRHQRGRRGRALHLQVLAPGLESSGSSPGCPARRREAPDSFLLLSEPPESASKGLRGAR